MNQIVYFRRDGCGYVRQLEDQLPALRDPMATQAAGIVVSPPSGHPTPSIAVNGRVISGSDKVLPILRGALAGARNQRRGSMPSYGGGYGYGTFGLAQW